MTLLSDRFVLWLRRVTNLDLPGPTAPAEATPPITDADLAHVSDGLIDAVTRAVAGPTAAAIVEMTRTVTQALRSANPDDAYSNLARRDFVDAATRLAGCPPTTPEFRTVLAEIGVIDAAMRYLADPADTTADRLETTRYAYAQALFMQFAEGADLSASMFMDGAVSRKKTDVQRRREEETATRNFYAYIADAVRSDNARKLANVVRVLTDLSPPKQRIIRGGRALMVPARQPTGGETLAATLSGTLAGFITDFTKAERSQPAMPNPFTKRTPRDVLWHLMTIVRSEHRNREAPELRALQGQGKTLILKHAADGEAVSQLIDDAVRILGDSDATDLAAALRDQLPSPAVPPAPAQLQDNLYGRVFETKLVETLLDRLPEPLADITHRVGQAIFDLPEMDDLKNEALTEGLDRLMEEIGGESRPWAGGAGIFDDIRAIESPGYNSDEEDFDDFEENVKNYYARIINTIRTFLKEKPETGQDLLASTYLSARLLGYLATALPGPEDAPAAGNASPSLWTCLNSSTDIYSTSIVPKVDRKAVYQQEIEGAGLTLLHQPTATSPTSQPRSKRPVVEYRIPSKPGTNADLPDNARLAIENGVVLGSGISGTTCIMLHVFDHLKTIGKIDTETPVLDFLLSQILFLVFDGGHSMHEVLWTARLLDEKLGLNLDLGSLDDLDDEFVSDYDAFIEKFGPALRTALRSAVDVAWDGTQTFLDTFSAYVANSPAARAAS